MLLDLVVGAAVALVASFFACRAMIGVGPIDVPDADRKGHLTPTPTSGGMGIAIGFAAGLIALCMFSVDWRQMVSAQGAWLLSTGAGFAFAFLGLGFIDDARPIGPRLKSVLFSVLALGAAMTIGVVEKLPINGELSIGLGYGVGLIGTALWVFTMVNCTNFMDGANGLAMGSIAIGLLALGAIALMDGTPSGAAMTFGAAGALAGFLIWNYPGGRLFAGDAGALFAGAIASIAALLIIRRTGLSPFVPPLIFFPLLADALLTLAWRASRRRSLLDGHSEHIYQIAGRAGWGRARITLWYWGLAAVFGALGVYVSRAPESPFAWIALAISAALALVVTRLLRNAALKRGIAEV